MRCLLGSPFVVQAMDDVMKDIKEGKLVVEDNQRRSVLQPATPAPPGAQRRGANMDENMLNNEEAQLRARQVRRLELMNDVPHSVPQALSSSLSSTWQPVWPS